MQLYIAAAIAIAIIIFAIAAPEAPIIFATASPIALICSGVKEDKNFISQQFFLMFEIFMMNSSLMKNSYFL